MSTAPKFPARPAIFLFGPALPGINILQNLYNGLTTFCGKGMKTQENFVKYWYNLWFN